MLGGVADPCKILARICRQAEGKADALCPERAGVLLKYQHDPCTADLLL
jgi:hypothetical protein